MPISTRGTIFNSRLHDRGFVTMSDRNVALWLRTPGAPMRVEPAPLGTLGPAQVRVLVRAVAINSVDGIPEIA